MVDRLMRPVRMSYLLPLALAIGGAVGAPNAAAQAVLPDPTRPPAAFVGGADEAAVASGPRLQSVLLPKAGKPVAVISGQRVTLGGMLGARRLVALSENEAVLKGPDGVERLRLTPDVEKTNLIAKTPAAKRGQSKGKQ